MLWAYRLGIASRLERMSVPENRIQDTACDWGSLVRQSVCWGSTGKPQEAGLESEAKLSRSCVSPEAKRGAKGRARE